MPLARDKDMFGLAALKAALQRQEGGFMRAATYIEGPKKELTVKETTNERTAKALLDRNAAGQFVKKDEGYGR